MGEPESPVFLSWAWIRRFLSHDCSPFEQFLKYAAIGALSTIVQVAVFYACAATFLQCLKPDDLAVRFLGLPAAQVNDATRTVLAGGATGIGFFISNVFCWLMNRWFVFKAGKYAWYVEFGLFFSASLVAFLLGIAIQSVAIYFFGLMTTYAVFIEILTSLAINYVARKFLVFKG